MNKKIVYSFECATGLFNGITTAWESPLEPGVFLMPAYTTEIQPNITIPGKINRWDGKAWVLEDEVNFPKPMTRAFAEAILENRKDYLSKTDWYIIRQMDISTSCPQEIKEKRASVRAEIDLIKEAILSNDLEKIPTDFLEIDSETQ